jgi:hypothetical protein
MAETGSLTGAPLTGGYQSSETAGHPTRLQKWRKNKRGVDAGHEAHYDLRGTMKCYFWIRTRLLLWQARCGFAVIGAWFVLDTLIFRHAGGLSYHRAILNAVYLEEGDWGTVFVLEASGCSLAL